MSKPMTANQLTEYVKRHSFTSARWLDGVLTFVSDGGTVVSAHCTPRQVSFALYHAGFMSGEQAYKVEMAILDGATDLSFVGPNKDDIRATIDSRKARIEQIRKEQGHIS